MIKLLGEPRTNEYRAAERILGFFEEAWPGISNSPKQKDDIIIRSHCQLSGQQRNEIDIIIVGKLSPDRKFTPKRAVRDRNGHVIKNHPIYLRSIVAAGEEKSHPPEKVKADGETVQVKYKNTGWTDATLQNNEQKYSVMNYLKMSNLKPFVLNFLYLSNVSGRLGNSVNPTMDADEFFSRLVADAKATRRGNSFEISCCTDQTINSILKLCKIFFNSQV